MTTLDVAPTTEQRSAMLTRLAGIAGLAFIVIAFAGSMDGPFFSDDTTQQIVAWVRDHPTKLAVQGVEIGVQMCLMALILGRLVKLSGDRGPLRTISIGAIVANVGVAWAEVAGYFGIADAGQRDGGDAAVMALFSLVRQSTFTDGFLFGVSVACASLLCLRHATMSRTLCWLGVLLGAFKVLELPVQLAITGTPDGILGPIGTVLLLVWLLATSVTLVIRPRR